MRDLHNNIKTVASILSVVGNNDTEGTGAAVDLAGFESAELIFNVGQSGDTLSGSVYIELYLQESADGSTGWAAPAAADILGTNGVLIDAAAEDEVVVKIGYQGSKRYIRAFVDFTGTHTNGIPISATAILGHAHHAPVA
jgi:hypothetical protein